MNIVGIRFLIVVVLFNMMQGLSIAGENNLLNKDVQVKDNEPTSLRFPLSHN